MYKTLYASPFHIKLVLDVLVYSDLILDESFISFVFRPLVFELCVKYLILLKVI